jgi:hypothetical protein
LPEAVAIAARIAIVVPISGFEDEEDDEDEKKRRKEVELGHLRNLL